MSEKYALVREYYLRGLWKADRVHSAIGRWITQEEYDQILSEV